MNLRPRGRVSRFIAAWLALSIGLASVQAAWAKSPKRCRGGCFHLDRHPGA